MTTFLPAAVRPFQMVVPADVYAPQADSHLLIDALTRSPGLARGRAVDLCTGSGVLAIAAAKTGAAEVVAYDISISAVHAARANATAADVGIDVRHGSFEEALEHGCYDLVVSNPPYVPAPLEDEGPMPASAGPAAAWNAGVDGRMVLDPLCSKVSELLAPGGSFLLVHSEFADAEASLRSLRDSGLSANVIASQRIPFGPVLEARSDWLERTGRLQPGCRWERLVVIRADKPAG